MRLTKEAVVAATLLTGVSAGPHRHQHRHLAKHAVSPVKRDSSLVVIPQVVYELEGEVIPEDQAKAGLNVGLYEVSGHDGAIPSRYTTNIAPTATSKPDAKFIEQHTSAGPPAPPPAASAPPSPPGPAVGGAKGVDSEFPSGTIPCSQFPSDYGAIALPWLQLGGWAGIQRTPNFALGNAAISYIETGIAGDNCKANCFCSYHCPPGYEKAQWPGAQGNTGQSIGGLYCNPNGMLELSRPEVKTLCQKGAGGIYVTNKLGAQVATCKTDYAGTESMTLPYVANPGETVELVNPVRSKTYFHNGSPTSAQYYINPAGLPVDDACVWNSKAMPNAAGNWAAINLGVGQGADGLTYISMFPNAPTTSAKCDYAVKIVGDVDSPCSYHPATGYSNGKPTGCTVTVPPGGRAEFVFEAA